MPAAAAIASMPGAILNASTSGSINAVARALGDNPGNNHDPWPGQTRGQRDLVTQLVISLVLGLSAFFSFCVCPLVPVAR